MPINPKILFSGMDCRPILKDAKKIEIHLDSRTFEDMLEQGDRVAFAILRHCDSDCLEFVRSPLETGHDELRKVVEYQLLTDDNSNINGIRVDGEKTKIIMGFGYRMDDIRLIAKEIFCKDEINKEELDTITTVFIQAVFNRTRGSNIYITDNKILLKKRLWFESHFPGVPLNIMSIGEASILLDLFFKKEGNYYATCRYSLNKGYWYLLSMRLKVPRLNFGDAMINALATRLTYALMALDEIGITW